MKKVYLAAIVAAFAISPAMAGTFGPKSENPAFNQENSPGTCTGTCLSNGVVQFGSSGGIANANGQAGDHASSTAPITDPKSSAFDMNVKPPAALPAVQ